MDEVIDAQTLVRFIQKRFEKRSAKKSADETISIVLVLNNGTEVILHTVGWTEFEFIHAIGLSSNGNPVEIIVHFTNCQFKIIQEKIVMGEKPKEVKFGFATPD